MASDRPVIHVSTLAVTLFSVALFASLLALAVIDASLAIIVVFFACIFGGDLLRTVTTSLADGVTTVADADDTDSEASTTTDPLETLRARYARGELSDTEFERKLEALVETETEGDVARYLNERARHDKNDYGGNRDFERSTE